MYFAKIENNLVTEVLRVAEDKNSSWLEERLGGTWVECLKTADSQKLADKKRIAAIGFEYDADKQVFYSIQPFNSWVFNETTWSWDAPIPQPDGPALWNEETLSWEEVVTDG